MPCILSSRIWASVSGDVAGLATGELKKSGFEVNAQKTSVMHQSRAQVVCGIVVNEGLSIGRKYRRQLRSAQHYSETGRQPHLSGCGAFKPEP